MHKLFVLILMALLSLPISVLAEDNGALQETQSVIDTVNKTSQQTNLETVNRIDEDNIEPETSYNNHNTNLKEKNIAATPYKQPVSKRKIAFKFIVAMCGVAISSLTIFVILSIYNRIREGFVPSAKTNDRETSLETPDDMESAVKTFLDKTNWL